MPTGKRLWDKEQWDLEVSTVCRRFKASGKFLSVLFKDAVNQRDHIATAIDEYSNMKRWWNDINRRRPKYPGKTVPVPICPPQIPHKLGWDWIRTSVVKDWRLTVWAMVWSFWNAAPCQLANTLTIRHGVTLQKPWIVDFHVGYRNFFYCDLMSVVSCYYWRLRHWT
jgi:hypothetical protein